VLQERADNLFGVVNGIDMESWDPSSDPHIAAKFSADDLSGKAVCKKALQERFGLEAKPDVPLIGMVCRLVDQKGLDILAEALPELTNHAVQFAVLGRGDPRYHDLLSEAEARHAGQFGVLLDYDDAAAHQIEAGADMFLMPSRFEPCGLNQLYSLMYGTIPVVRATGGLADTVTDYTEEGLESGAATGFVFRDYGAAALTQAVVRALDLYRHKEAWQRLMANGMRQDWSWRRSAAEYRDVYARAREKAGV
jgi:starch synthase